MIGALLLLTVVAAVGDWYDFVVRFGGPHGRIKFPLAYISPGEFRLWLAFVFLLVPAGVLLGVALRVPLETLLGKIGRTDHESAPRSTRGWMIGLMIVAALGYRVGRYVLLRDQMVTDDETIIRFGGQIFAQGQLMAERIWPEGSVTEYFTYSRGNLVNSADWPGGLAVAALAELSGLGGWLYAALAAVSMWAVIEAARVAAGSRGAWIAGALWLVSPMVWSLSLTRHTHLVSRMWVALAFLAVAKLVVPSLNSELRVSRRARGSWALALGAFAGASFLCRPYETTAMLAPTAIWLLHAGLVRGGDRRQQLLMAVTGFLPFVGLYCAYNYAQTGDPLLTPRGANWLHDKRMMRHSVWGRAGQNLGFNVLMLAIWFQGVLGWPLAWLGFARASERRRIFPTLLLLGVGCQLLIALGHSDVGIHIVGPIHYSETAPALTLLAMLGLIAVADWCSQRGLRLPWLRSVFVGYLTAVAAFGGIFGGSLYNLGQIMDIPYRAIRQAGLKDAIVVSARPSRLERRVKDSSGTWQLAHPPPDPLVRDDVFFVRPDVDLSALRKAFPKREIYELHFDARRKRARVEVLPQGVQPAPEVLPRRPKTKSSERAKGKSKASEGNASQSKAAQRTAKKREPKSRTGKLRTAPKKDR